ncbi:MAG TPA: DUF748 domain-containing protein [Methylomirabilota bacterium]|nr:DUF748 domain-containing protein [Methylomirabilota bacterium]
MRRSHRRGLWIAGSLALLVIAAWIAVRSLDEPVRRYMEAEVNRRLTGYTVSIPGLRLHLLAAAIEMREATLVQNDNPDPAVLHIRRLVTSLDWRALIHGRVVADVTFDHPTVHLDLRQVRSEVADPTPVKERGWQEALEALTLDLKINRLRILQGDVTYADRGPFKPLHLSHLNIQADNIRNIRTQERTYPSEIHLEGVVFEQGQIWLDGHADFLATPYPGVEGALWLERIALDYFRPLTNRYNMSVRNGTLSLEGGFEVGPNITRVSLEQVRVQGVALEYTHTRETAGAEKARVEQTAAVARQATKTPTAQLAIKRLDVTGSTFGFVNRAASPAYRLQLTDTDITLQHLSNQPRDGHASIALRGQLMGKGSTRISASVKPRPGRADLDITTLIEDADLPRLSDVVRAHGGVGVTQGALSIYSELKLENGTIEGYVKPLVKDVRIDGSADGDRSLKRRLYEGMMNVAGKVLKNHSRGEVATVVHVSGPLERPRVSRWETIGRLLQNAFLKPIVPGLDPSRAPGGERAPAPDAPKGGKP